MRRTYIKQCERCGATFEAGWYNVRFCKPCVEVKRRRESAERKGLSSSFWDKEPSHESMHRLSEIAKYGLHYHKAKKEFERKEG